jgi:hypothetical protein
MMKYSFLAFLVIVSALLGLFGCLPDEPSATMELYIENKTDRALVVAVNGVNYGEIPANAMSEFLLFDKNSDEYEVAGFDPLKNYLFKVTYPNKELKKIGVDEHNKYEKYKLIISQVP